MKENVLYPDANELTPALKTEIKDLMQTEGWGTMEVLNVPASQVELLPVERDLPEPPEAAEIRRATWLGKLEERQDELRRVNISTPYTIHGDLQTANQALFEQLPDGQEMRRMWAGTTITLAQQGMRWEGNRFRVPVYPINYTEWIACYDPGYAQAFRNNGLAVPYAGIGVSVLMETTDGFFPLTRRGIETPVYPGRLYPPGGGPKPGQTSTGAIMEEIIEETGLQSGIHFDPSELFMLAMVSDTHFADSEHARPELVAYLPLNTNYREVEVIQHEQSMRKGQRQEDVWGVVPFSTFPPNLQRGIIYSGFEMCPTAEAGLAHAAFYLDHQRDGTEAAIKQTKTLMQRIKAYGRSSYVPPISRLPVGQ